MNKEFIAKAQAAKSPEELFSLARENNIEMTEEQAKVIFDHHHEGGELEDEELEDAAGGFSFFGGKRYVDPWSRCLTGFYEQKDSDHEYVNGGICLCCAYYTSDSQCSADEMTILMEKANAARSGK